MMVWSSRTFAVAAACLILVAGNGGACAADVGPIPFTSLGKPNGPAKLDAQGGLAGPVTMLGAGLVGPYQAPYLIGQLPAFLNTFIYPPAFNTTDQQFALGAQINGGDGNLASLARVAVWGWADTGLSDSPVWGANFGAQWNPGTPDVAIQGVEIDCNNNNSNTFVNGKNCLTMFSGGNHHAGAGMVISASSPGINDFLVGVSIGEFVNQGLVIAAQSQAPGKGGIVLRQVSNQPDQSGILIQRASDTAPMGTMLGILNRAANANLFSIDALGNTYNAGGLSVIGTLYVGGAATFVQAPTIPTVAPGDNTTKAASTSFAQTALTAVPATSASACTTGQKAADTNFFYVCVAANVWKRVALASF